MELITEHARFKLHTLSVIFEYYSVIYILLFTVN